MNRLIDKLIVLILCMACYFQYASGDYLVVPIICAIALSALCSYFDKDAVSVTASLAYCVASVAFPIFFFFLPLICYDIMQTRLRVVGLAAVIPAAAGFESLPMAASVFTILFLLLSCAIRMRSASLEKVKNDSIRLRDAAKEFSMELEVKNRELMEKQDYEVNLATLNERNRIARDIHDNVGHVLSNSILQTGALMATCKDEALRGRLNTLRETLAQGMDRIRESLHDLHDDSVDLYTEIKVLADNFNFCPASLQYCIEGNPDRKIKYALIAIVKEALSNIIRHSNATQVDVALHEHPALYQLVVKDNGTVKNPGGEGLGLRNIEQRVNSLKGFVNINSDSGFTVFVSIPKER